MNNYERLRQEYEESADVFVRDSLRDEMTEAQAREILNQVGAIDYIYDDEY